MAKAEEEIVSREERKEALIALIEHRTREVDHLRTRISYYQSQLEEAEKKLSESQSLLARLHAQSNELQSKSLMGVGNVAVKEERRSESPVHVDDDCSSGSRSQSRTELVIPCVIPKMSHPVKVEKSGSDLKPSSGSSPLVHSNGVVKVKRVNLNGIINVKDEVADLKGRGTKRKFEHKERQELIPLVARNASPTTVRCQESNHIPSQHKRKLRSLVLCPGNDQLFVTSALDGVVNLWELQHRGSNASLLSSTDCMAVKERRWPEDMAWHPQGKSLVATYSSDKGDIQISIIDLNKTKGKARVTFLDDKPHTKGIINSVEFMPWESTCFATGGSDHAVILWTQNDRENSWKPKTLHKHLHSAAVMGVAGMQENQIVLSAGADKRIIGYDVQADRYEFKHQIDSKCMSVLPNPCDFNLFMVQAGTPEKQIRLFDIRLRGTEVHSFGFKQETSDSMSALISQAWSPDGLYLSSGSVDPIIHIFDIRYNSEKPSQSIRAHQKRVFKAQWHSSFPLLVSISSDLHIGLHKIT